MSLFVNQDHPLALFIVTPNQLSVPLVLTVTII